MDADDSFQHLIGCFLCAQMRDHEIGGALQEGLDERSGVYIVIDGIHFPHMDLGMCPDILAEILVGASDLIGAVDPWLIVFLYRGLSSIDGPACREAVDAIRLEITVIDQIVYGLGADLDLRMSGKDRLDRKAALKERCNDGGELIELAGRHVDTGPGFAKQGRIFFLGGIGIVLVLKPEALLLIGTAVAGKPAVALSAGKRLRMIARVEALAVLCFSMKRTGAVFDVDTIFDCAADDRTAEIFSDLKFFGRDGQTVKTNLFGNSAAVFAQSGSDSSARRPFNDPAQDDSTIITI